MHRPTRTLITATSTLLTIVALPTVALAAGSPRETTQLDCGGSGTVEIIAPSSPHDNWSAAQVVGGGHLIPVSFRHVVYDETADVTLFDGEVSHAPAHARQDAVTCSTTQTAVLGDVVPPDFVPPAGVEPTDVVSISFIATAVPKR